ncbi:hypothetical protein OKA05_07075 [Luteolibacter arcticus]|uniref:Ig-like domain-containing protein n=1 Tax=Luteolibacter arcticus TaxID=1581411 RepID=A0ABT3GG70_9BACT|nr:hypothetical protein [Luteolibacter arcticus]MCW1922310.1 hypothetical protein [Luteolibacter arcticus]
MKPILLKTLAAASLAATSHAEVHVLGAVWKERGVNAPLGTIIMNPGTVASTRGYLIMDDSVLTTTPSPATLIEYWEVREDGETTRLYSVNSDFTAFRADGIFGTSNGRRLYGHMYAPVRVADVTNPLIPFSGTTFSTNFPRKLSFDQTVFQTGASDTVTGPQIVLAGAGTQRSVVSGSANSVKTEATTIAEATAEFVARLVKQKYARTLVEAPTIIVDLAPTLQLQDGETSILTVTLNPDVIPGPIPGTDPVEFDDFAAPTYQWSKDNVAIPGAVGATFTVTGGASTATNGSGTYKVVVTNEVGSVTSGNTVVTPETTTFATNLQTPVPLLGANSTTLSVVLSPAPITAPTYQWVKGAALAGPFTNVPAAIGGNSPSLLVIGGEAATGAGFYRLDVTTSAGPISSAVSNVTVGAALTNFVFTTNSPRTLSVALSGTAKISPVINSAATPSPTLATRQWFKASLANPTVFTAIPDSNVIELEVSGNAANAKGPGVYRMVATNTATPAVTITTIDTVVTTAP